MATPLARQETSSSIVTANSLVTLTHGSRNRLKSIGYVTYSTCPQSCSMLHNHSPTIFINLHVESKKVFLELCSKAGANCW